MANLTSVLDIAKTALLATQKAINVTSHNIANANTPGYSRQKPIIEAMDTVDYGGLYFGTGVTVRSIERVYDSFQTDQLMAAESQVSRYGSKEGILKTLEAKLNDFSSAGLSAPIDKFFNSFQDIANNPSSYAERSVLLSNASVLTDRFNSIDSTIRLGLYNNNNELASKVNEANGLASQVADLNNQIAAVEVTGASASDLRDKRDVVLTSLAKIIDIKTVENKTGQVDVYIGSGTFLVAGVKTNTMDTNVNASNPSLYDVRVNGAVISDKIGGGSLKGILESNQYYSSVQDKLNLMSATLVKNVNLQHRQGYGLDSSTGQDFFSLPPVYMKTGMGNTGGAVISSGSISNLSLVTLNNYEVRFSSPANYSIVNTTNNTVAASGAYTSGSPITVDGLTFTITNNPGGPAAGDTFQISVTRNAAQNMGVGLTDPNKVAAASTLATLPGGNANALAMAGLKDAGAINGSTYGQYYNSIITDLGIKTKDATNNLDAQKKIAEQSSNLKESISGVSIEEEAINLVKLQRAYEAAAKVLSTADKMLETLLSLR